MMRELIRSILARCGARNGRREDGCLPYKSRHEIIRLQNENAGVPQF
jgi:hypothetical protein